MQFLLYFIIAYLVGSIPNAVWIGKLFFNTDVRNFGSKNAGATNTIRVLGTKIGVTVLILDILKGVLATNIPFFFNYNNINPDNQLNIEYACGIIAVFGHIFPIFAQFKGGKGVATLLGVCIALLPLPVLGSLIVFIIVFIITRYVSLSSMFAAVLLPFFSIIIFSNNATSQIIFTCLIAVIVPITHLKNIKRLLNGTESKFVFRKNK
ncbi:MAG: acyl-phosphate glycerol 3-phosphate acyltransferase [Bacteroidetes bacterium GWE2_29_8]|nr:MAG: acyl-phosphate glycerol 3-phosphate acyltransferase [Bacteroidetes bacterium GWE2_29_8]OFY16610.1 MAG: acyl-phosphate glycerol 3-phosphate acyltransferase [Bacteroidetes bacterium GWF2_29_10]